MKNKRLRGIMITVGILLLIPLIAMQFTNEVKWTLSDFIGAAILLGGTGLTCEFILRTVKKKEHRLLLCGIVLILLVLVWMELAVGIFGTPFAGS
ncbi:hypothetical protein NAT51_18575 [Flavobacterium amniphilum]|uniref:hypothetical protein n=1 Tax=Flavobacterium amniphilum TaxID=1834035 RepID=UPI002029DCB0|nr:hypothetical protein [Flavobacterium amniphilum]MCL9807535.1 hypothetical protein [Flavobacterium amniphilum]